MNRTKSLSGREDQNASDGAEQATASDERSHLSRAFQKLPPEQVKVLELSYFKGLNHEEISNSLNYPWDGKISNTTGH